MIKITITNLRRKAEQESHIRAIDWTMDELYVQIDSDAFTAYVVVDRCEVVPASDTSIQSPWYTRTCILTLEVSGAVQTKEEDDGVAVTHCSV